MPRKLHHIAVEVSDAKRSEAFYCDLLGFEKTGEFHLADSGRTIVFVELGDVCLELLQGADCEAYVGQPEMAGFKHVCMETDDIDGEIERLRAAGVKITTEPFDTDLNSRIAFFEDPDGLPLELWQDLKQEG